MIPSGYYWLNIFLLAIGTISIRFSIISISARIKISERTKEIFSYIPAAILPALVAPMIFFHKGDVAWIQGKERVLALFLTIIVCALTRSTLLTIAFGLGSLYLLRSF
jgi:branched-subunit amino acid transport protein